MARVVRFYETGGPEVLRIEEVAVPPPGKGEVQIRIHALGLNRSEVRFRSGQGRSAPRFPARPGYDAAGTVAAVGEGVRGFTIVDAVSVIPGFDMNDYGLYGDLANAPQAWSRTVHLRRAGRREPQAGYCQDIPARGDRRSPSLPGVESADRQGRRDGVTPARAGARRAHSRREL